MKPNLRRNLSGSFSPHDLGAGCWRLSRGHPVEIEIYLTDVENAAAEHLRCAALCGLAVEWRGPDSEASYGKIFPGAFVDAAGGDEIVIVPPQP